MFKNVSSCQEQDGGGSAYVGQFYSQTMVGGPAAISRETLKTIDQAPMFHPLSTTAQIPPISTGIIPVGLYLASLKDEKQKGGADSDHLLSLDTRSLRNICHGMGHSCRDEHGRWLSHNELIAKIRKNF